VRLLFDENLSVLSANWAANTLTVDVLDARAAGLAGKTVREVRRFAIETDRILVTLDADFGNLIRFSPVGTPGVIWLRPRPPTEANIRSILGKWLYRLRQIDLHGQLAVSRKTSFGSVELSRSNRGHHTFRRCFAERKDCSAEGLGEAVESMSG
jgi:predicted nuclease of predicted toxin-antitoxin system